MRPHLAVVYALLAALLFGISAPFSKLLVQELDPLFLAALLYLGAGCGMLVFDLGRRVAGTKPAEARLTRGETPFVILMIVLDIAAPVSLMLGLSMSDASTAALLGNFEIVATAIIAMILFREASGPRLWIAIVLISVASAILSVGGGFTISISWGAVFVLAASVCWGLENNCTRNLSIKDPLQIVVIKGFGSGLGALLIAYIWDQLAADWLHIALALVLGFVAYGLSIFFYVTAQRELGAARTSAYYAAAPFIGVLISWLALRETITPSFLVALLIMLLGAYLAVSEKHLHRHTHTVEAHEHKHGHHDRHHAHAHGTVVAAEHSHPHTHQAITHEHVHTPDLHHRHAH
jgi:drug/metabolite transporter (DMT)-like permease